MSRFSNAKNPAYPLRPNKAIDRSILQEILQTFDNYSRLNKHVYISLGGPFLEDFRLLASKYPKMSMCCIEMDSENVKRQIFHKCTKNMTINECTLREFLSSKYPSESPTITWADYTSGINSEILSEIADITRKAAPLSVIKVTINAEANKLRHWDKDRESPPRRARQFNLFKAEFKRLIEIEDVVYDDDYFRFESFSKTEYPKLLSKIIYLVIESACERPKAYLPIHSIMYSDGAIMLSVTGIMCREEDIKMLKKHFKDRFEYYSDDPEEVSIIDVPFLTTKERLWLESKIPSKNISGKRMVSYLGYLLDGIDSDKTSEEWMAQYEKYHRLYPYFGKLIP